MESTTQEPTVPKGIYCPTITFFTNDSSQDLNLEAQAKHAKYLFEAGVHGITVLGTTGEAPMLSRKERDAVTKAVVSAKSQMNAETTIVVGCSAQSVRETIEMCQEAKANGGQYALVLPPSYWAAASTPTVIENFYRLVADQSPIPVIIYSFPAVTQGVSMNSDLISVLAKHSNIVGVNLTCGNVGSLTRLTNTFTASQFAVFGGSSDWLVPGLIAGSCGAVTGLANTHPRSCVKLFDLFQNGSYQEARRLQGIISSTEWGMGNTGMNGTKYATEWFGGHEEKVLPRAPLMECSEKVKVWIRDIMKDLAVYESQLFVERSDGRMII
ncbi:hypothetical protein PENPOL_c026G02843 [Penicillium polonicum]|uniref:Dihydrodipicolinate synthase n=1 Tax=Penicillium polonicum TaxID=60169 RepID=A0A1V6N6X9_PENPO|nr:hypothetical protein PENPOL_c026G02843 [Penicillium polonicum]